MLLNALLVACMLAWAMVIGWAIYCGVGTDTLFALSLVYGGVYYGARHLFLS